MKGLPHPQMVWTQPFKIALFGGRWSESCFPRLRCAPSQRAVRSAAQSSAFHCRRSTQKWVSVAVSALDKFNRRASVPISTVTNYQSVLRSWLTFKRTYSAELWNMPIRRNSTEGGLWRGATWLFKTCLTYFLGLFPFGLQFSYLLLKTKPMMIGVQ